MMLGYVWTAVAGLRRRLEFVGRTDLSLFNLAEEQLSPTLVNTVVALKHSSL